MLLEVSHTFWNPTYDSNFAVEGAEDQIEDSIDQGIGQEEKQTDHRGKLGSIRGPTVFPGMKE